MMKLTPSTLRDKHARPQTCIHAEEDDLDEDFPSDLTADYYPNSGCEYILLEEMQDEIIEHDETEDAKWIVDGIDITAQLAELREITVKLAKPHSLSDTRLL